MLKAHILPVRAGANWASSSTKKAPCRVAKSLRPGSHSFGGTIMPPATIMVSAMIAAASLLVV